MYCFCTPGTLRYMYIWIGSTVTPRVALVCVRPTQLQKTSHFATPLTTALAVLFLKIFKLCFTNTCIFRLVHVATVIGILGFFNVKFVIFEGKYRSKAFV